MATPYKVCPECQNPAHLGASQCIQCGHRFRTSFVPRPDQTQGFNLPAPAITPAPNTSQMTVLRTEPSRPVLIAAMWLFVIGCVVLWTVQRNAALAANIGAIMSAVILAMSPSRTNRVSGWIMLALQSVLIVLVLSGILRL
jgi:hypothetical protein